MQGYSRADGRKGIRNNALVVHLDEPSRHVARRIVRTAVGGGAQTIGFAGAAPSRFASAMLEQLCTHPNVGAALLLSGGSGIDPAPLATAVAASGRPVQVLEILRSSGTVGTIAGGVKWLAGCADALATTPRVPMAVEDLVVGSICGGSDATSAISANPAIGLVFDRLVAEGAACLFEETGELIGCDRHMAGRAATSAVAEAILRAMAKATRFFDTLGHGSFAPGNAEGGLTTIEEKSLGAYAKSGSALIAGVLKPGGLPSGRGLYLMDKIPDGEVRYGFSDATDNVGVAEMIACGAHLILFSTGRGSVVGSAVAPVVKVCANPQTYRALQDDMDVDAGRVLEGRGSLKEVAAELYACIQATAAGEPTRSEALGHQEFLLTYKHFDDVPTAAE